MTLKKFLLLPLFMVLLLSFSWGQQTTSANKTTGKQLSLAGEPADKGLLWKISGNDLKDPSYLFGTIHLIDKENFFFPSGTLSAFEKAKKVVFEIDMNDMNDMSMLFSMMSGIMMSGGKTLADLLSEDDYNLVKEHFTQMGLPFMMFERLKPMFLSIMASMDMDPSSLSSGEMKSYEMEFMEMASAQQKETGGLETIAFQMSLFDSIPYEAQAEMLVQAIQTAADANSNQQFEEMIKLYKAQDIEKLQQSISEDESGISEFEELLLTKRNEAWIPQMKKMMTENITFFAVGAGHLGGKNGVINLLRKEGYTLEAVK